MIIDLEQLETSPFKGKYFDVCVCGAGVAGITLARKLVRTQAVVLLEDNGFEFSRNSQELYEGTNTGHSYFDPDATRLRFFGGTPNHWAGFCRHLDNYDFQKKDYLDTSGWPIGRSDLDPIWRRHRRSSTCLMKKPLASIPASGPFPVSLTDFFQ